MPRSLPSLAELFPGRLRLLLWPAAAALGIAAEWALYGWGHARDWAPDLVTGWSLIACGLIAWSRRPESRSGALMVATGFAWFAANFAATGVGATDWLSGHALYLHRGPLVQLVLTYPRGRSAGRLERSAVAVGYVAALVTAIWQSEVATIVLAALLIGVAIRGNARAVGRERRARLYALQATAFLAVVLAATAAVRLAVPTQGAKDATLLAYQVALCALAIGPLIGLLRAPWERAAVTDLVVELGQTRSGTLRDALARALGDPKLEVGYRLSGGGVYVDAAGRPVPLPAPGSERRVTRVERDGQEVAALIHDPAVLDDPALFEAVTAAARLAASNAKLQAEVRARVAELQASRRRLVEAGDDERRRLEHRLSEGAARRLASLEQVLARARRRAQPNTVHGIERAESQLARTLDELRELAAGLHPRELVETGFAPALASLAARSPVPVALAVTGDRLPAEIEAAAYFVCSETLANVAKHASASGATVTVRAGDGRVRVDVVDDGVGGADPGGGSGLGGLADRVEALGGRLRIDSPKGSGTRISADIPLG